MRVVTTIIIRHVLLLALMICCAFAVMFADVPTALWLSLAFTVPGLIGAVVYFALVRSWTRWLAVLCALAVLVTFARVFWRLAE